MNTENLRDWLEIIGIFGVIASLIFVGLQLKQDREIAAAGAFQERSAMYSEAMHSLAANENALRAMIKAQGRDPDAPIDMPGVNVRMTMIESLAMRQAASAMAVLGDNSYYQFQAGFLPEEHWLAVREEIKRNLRSSRMFRSIMLSEGNSRRPEYNAEIRRMIAEVDAEGSTP